MGTQRKDVVSVLVLGANGRLGRILSQFWPVLGLSPRWQQRQSPLRGCEAGSVVWDILSDPLPKLGPIDIVLGLAGVVPGRPQDLSMNTDLALATLDIARKSGAKHVFLSSSAAVYGSKPGLYSEVISPRPDTPYGRAKLAMEAAVLAAAADASVKASCLRIGNVAGADALLGTSAAKWRSDGRDAVVLDQFSDGKGPHRSYIGPRDLADVLAALCRLGAQGVPLPTVLNVAAPGPVAMSDLLNAARVAWKWQPAPETAVAQLVLDVATLAALYPFGPNAAQPEHIVAQWEALPTAR